MDSKPLFILLNDNEWKYMDSKKITSTRGGRSFIGVFIMCSCINRFIYYLFILKSATTRLYDTEAKIICIVSKKGAQCIECHHKDI